MGELLYKNKFIEIKSDQRDQCVEITGMGIDDSDDINLFHELLDVIISYIIGLHPRYLIFRVDKGNYLADTEILKTMFFPKIIELGINSCAFVIGEDTKKYVYYEELINSLSNVTIDSGVDLQLFHDEVGARRWIASK